MLYTLLTQYAAACAKPSFFGIPPWYQYFPVVERGGICEVQISFTKNGAVDFSSILLVGLGLMDILLRAAALVAAGFIIYAGLQYVTAQGEPDKAKRALGTIINALVGLGITIGAAAIVSFVGNRIGTDVS